MLTRIAKRIRRIAYFFSGDGKADEGKTTKTKVGVLSPGAQADRDAFFQHRRDRVIEEEELTPLQRRMQSGGA